MIFQEQNQPPSGGCVLKRHACRFGRTFGFQPPSGGCVLKPVMKIKSPAYVAQPPSGGCVLKQTFQILSYYITLPAAFRRLCVETGRKGGGRKGGGTSRLQAAVC